MCGERNPIAGCPEVPHTYVPGFRHPERDVLFAIFFASPHYSDDIFLQADIIGFGSLPIVILTGFFTGAVMGLQMSRALAQYGATGQIGAIVAITLVRELGPVLSSITSPAETLPA